MNRPRLTWLISLLDPATRAAFLAKCESEGPQSVTAGNEDVADAEWLRDALRPYALAEIRAVCVEKRDKAQIYAPVQSNPSITAFLEGNAQAFDEIMELIEKGEQHAKTQDR